MARRFWPNEDPVGKRMKAGFDNSQWCTVAGIVGDVKHTGLDADVNAEMYYQYLQVPPALMSFVEGTMTLLFRTTANPTQITPSARNEFRNLNAHLPAYHST